MFVLGGCLRYLVGVGGFNPFEKPVAFSLVVRYWGPVYQVKPTVVNLRGRLRRLEAVPWGASFFKDSKLVGG